MLIRCLTFSLLSLLLVACDVQSPNTPSGPPKVVLPASYRALTRAEADALIASNPDLGVLDLRDDPERTGGVPALPRAEPMPYHRAHATELAQMDRKRPWLLSCTLGGRSELMAQEMASLGFEQVYWLKLGLRDDVK